ncbi:branched-chain amino acid transaminase [candidate division FCPU426 bacterium]|nr:branched-chain amino acid transaminase [candidate division FCPU426 bacterium]
MGFPAKKIWMDGKLIPWDEAKVHVMIHALHYGSCAFEGLRMYANAKGSFVLRFQEHMKRLLDSAKIYRMTIPYTLEQLMAAVKETLLANDLEEAYIRPFIFRGYHSLGLSPFPCPVVTAIAAWSWGPYLGKDALEKGVSIRIASWNRPAPNTLPTMAKVAGNYMNSQLIKMEALQDGFDEGIALDTFGYISEGSGENVFIVKNGVLFTPPSSSSILPGITRHCVFQLARDLGYQVKQHVLPRESLYVADEAFMTGTAAEITPIAQVDKIPVSEGKRGPITQAIQAAFFGILRGEQEDKHGWLTKIR